MARQKFLHISESSKEYIRKNYPGESKDKILNDLPELNWQQIQSFAIFNKIKRSMVLLSLNQRNGKLENLFTNSNQSYYWLGFIAADGHISKKGRLCIHQTEKSKDNILRLAKFLETDYSTKANLGFSSNKVYEIKIQDFIYGKRLLNLFTKDPNKTKTYTGISLDFIKNYDQAISFLIGFIEGDGCKNKKVANYNIQSHYSWYETFLELEQKLPIEMRGNNIKIFNRTIRNEPFKGCYFILKSKQSLYMLDFIKTNNIDCSDKKFYNYIK